MNRSKRFACVLVGAAVSATAPAGASGWASAVNAYRITAEANRSDGKDKELIRRLMRKIDFDGRLMMFVTETEKERVALQQLRQALAECSAEHPDRCMSEPVRRRIDGTPIELTEVWTLHTFKGKDGQERSMGGRLFISCEGVMVSWASSIGFDAPYGMGEPKYVLYDQQTVLRGQGALNQSEFHRVCEGQAASPSPGSDEETDHP